MPIPLSEFKSSWKNALSNTRFKLELPVTIVLLTMELFFFTKFLVYVEARKGVVLNDPVLEMFNAMDLNYIIFGLIYFSLLTGLVLLALDPKRLVIALQTYMLMVLFRMAAMYTVPLEPPVGTIDLLDPIVFIVGTGQKLTKDLFFSGHTATLFILSLTAGTKRLRSNYLVFTAAVGICVILQKVHYTVDVLAALFFAYGAYRIVKYFHKKKKVTDE